MCLNYMVGQILCFNCMARQIRNIAQRSTMIQGHRSEEAILCNVAYTWYRLKYSD
jgi:hypothetical protein